MTTTAYLLCIPSANQAYISTVAHAYEFDSAGRCVSKRRWSSDRPYPRLAKARRPADWTLAKCAEWYGTKKGDNPSGYRGAFGSLEANSKWRRVTKCQFRSFLRSKGVNFP